MYWFTSRTLRTVRYAVFGLLLAVSATGGALRFGVPLLLHGGALFSPTFDFAVLGALAVLTPALFTCRIVVLRAEFRADVIGVVLRHLYHQLFGANAGHRISFLAPRRPASPYLRPRYRYAYGLGTRIRSRARFRRGSALAGMAWQEPGRPFFQTIPRFFSTNDIKPRWWRVRRRSWRLYERWWINPGERQFLTYAQERLNLSAAAARRLGWRTQHQEWIFSYGFLVPSTDTVLVLSIDSPNPQDFTQVQIRDIETAAALIVGVCQHR